HHRIRIPLSDRLVAACTLCWFFARVRRVRAVLLVSKTDGMTELVHADAFNAALGIVLAGCRPSRELEVQHHAVANARKDAAETAGMRVAFVDADPEAIEVVVEFAVVPTRKIEIGATFELAFDLLLHPKFLVDKFVRRSFPAHRNHRTRPTRAESRETIERGLA